MRKFEDEGRQLARIYFDNCRYIWSFDSHDDGYTEEVALYVAGVESWEKIESSPKFRFICEQLIPRIAYLKTKGHYGVEMGEPFLDHESSIVFFDWLFHAISRSESHRDLIISFEKYENEIETIVECKKGLTIFGKGIHLLKGGEVTDMNYIQGEDRGLGISESFKNPTARQVELIERQKTKEKQIGKRVTLETVVDDLNHIVDSAIEYRKIPLKSAKYILMKTKGRDAEIIAFVRTLSSEFKAGLDLRLDGTVANITNALWGTDLSAQQIRDKLK